MASLPLAKRAVYQTERMPPSLWTKVHWTIGSQLDWRPSVGVKVYIKPHIHYITP